MIIKLLLVIALLPNTTNAYSLDCYDVEGASIFGWDSWDDEYEFIGAVSNEYNSESIANEYGAGNEYSSDSIMNDYGDYGSDYSSESAFNDYASNPPILLDDDLDFIGYLTTNSSKSPYINTYMAMACAKETYVSASSRHEDYRFDRIPGSSYSRTSGGGYTEEQLRLLLEILNKQNENSGCPSNSHENPYDSTKCLCNEGYKINSTKTACLIEVPTYTCPINTYQNPQDSTKCLCNAGYIINSTKDGCILEPAKPVVNTCPNNAHINPNNKTKCICNYGFIINTKKDGCKRDLEQRAKVNTTTVVGHKPLKKTACPSNSYKEGGECICDEGFGKSINKQRCVKIPDNAYYVDSPTDIWLCNEGFRESGNSCITIMDTASEDLENMSMEEDDKEVPQSIWDKIMAWFE